MVDRMVSDQLYNGLIHLHSNMLQQFGLLERGTAQQQTSAKEQLKKLIYNFGIVINQINRATIKNAETVENLLVFADMLDEFGAYALADKATELASIIKVAYVPMMREEKKEDLPVKQLRDCALSTRYCPDHRGVQASRVSEHVYQCPIDGKTYDYEFGYVNYDGQIVPGGSVAAQTPDTSNYFGVPIRYFGGDQNVLNNIN